MIKPQNKKPSKQFINYLKNTSTIPQLKPQPLQQKQSPCDQTYRSPMEGDFSKIGVTYVLEHDRLRKKSILYAKPGATMKHNQKYEETQDFIEEANVELIKQIAKLEYLEKKGFLKPDQAKRLQNLRQNKELANLCTFEAPNTHFVRSPKPHRFLPQMDRYKTEPQNVDPNLIYQMEYQYSDKKIRDNQYKPQVGIPISYGYQAQYYEKNLGTNPKAGYHANYIDPRQKGYY